MCLFVPQVRFEGCECVIAPLLLDSGCQATLSGLCTATGNKGAAGFVVVTRGASLLIEGTLCASNNTGVENPNLAIPATSFASVTADGSLRVADSASVQVDGEGLDVFAASAGVDVLNNPTDAGRLLCGSTSSSSWQPGSYDINGDLCACTAEFQLGTKGQSRTCDGCRGASCVPATSVRQGPAATLPRRRSGPWGSCAGEEWQHPVAHVSRRCGGRNHLLALAYLWYLFNSS